MASASSSRVRLISQPTSLRSASKQLASARFLSHSTARLDSKPHDAAAPSSAPSLTGSDKLLAEALRLEAEEEDALSKRSRQPDPNDPIWTGEERVQDTVLRMVMDKYKPLRIRVGDESKNPADEKIKAGIQTPTTPAPAADEPDFNLFMPPGVEGAHEGGRKLPKTPDEKPWRAVYVRPAHLLGAGAAEDKPSIYYGQFLKPGSEMRSKLKAAGVGSLPVDDPKAMSALRQGLKTAERRGKLLRARESVLDYQLSSQSSQSAPESDELKGDTISDTNRNLQLQLGHAQGWDSVIEQRIKAALESGAFKENKLRGKPIQRDMEEKNPFLAREEYFMNRIVKRQGAAPPWVELNVELETELKSWRERLDDSWARRASRMISTSGVGVDMEPLPLGQMHATTPGQQKLLDTATRYRDPEWMNRERAYHTHELHRLNDLIRKHNHLAPFTARKGLMVLDVELNAMLSRCVPLLVSELSALYAKGGVAARIDAWDARVKRQGVLSFDMWGREVQPIADAKAEQEKGWLHGWLGSGTSGGGERGGGGDDVGQQGSSDTGKAQEVQSLGLLAAIQKSLQWARQRIVGG